MRKKIGVFVLKMLNAYCFKTPWHDCYCSHCMCHHIRYDDKICILEKIYRKVERWTDKY